MGKTTVLVLTWLVTGQPPVFQEIAFGDAKACSERADWYSRTFNGQPGMASSYKAEVIAYCVSR